jgi:hypothetical protein
MRKMKINSVAALPEGFVPKWETVWLSLQWKEGFAGMGKGWDKDMVKQIHDLGLEGFELVSVVPQHADKWYILFFKRQIS